MKECKHECTFIPDNFNMEPTLIILKHSLEENKVPTPNDLKNGEVALSLFPGQESLWVKNGKGEVIDIRKPTSESLWESVLTEIPSREEFNKELEEGNIDRNKIYFIALEKQIWVKGEFYASAYNPSELDALFASKFVVIPEAVGELDFDQVNSDQMEEAWGGKQAFRDFARKIESGKVSAAMSTKAGNIPVGVETKIDDGDKIYLNLEYILHGKYFVVKFSLKYDIFGVEYWNEVEIGAQLEDDIKDLKERMKAAEEGLCWIEAY